LGKSNLAGGSANRPAALRAAFEAIRQYEGALAQRFLEQLGHLPGWHVRGISSLDRLGQRVPTFGLTHDRWKPEELALELSKRGVFTWSGHFYAPGLIETLGLAPNGMLRVGLLHYNAAEEVDRFVEILNDLEHEYTG
jgi:selenocysteine lyase/cysteine desulfurase